MTIFYQFVTILTFLVPSFSELVELWSTEHLTDLIMSDAFRKVNLSEQLLCNEQSKTIKKTKTNVNDKGYSSSPTSSDCVSTLRSYGFTDHSLPNALHFVVATFDRKAAKNVWYQWDEDVMDVFKYYDVNTTDKPMKQWCPTILFQPQNWSEPIQFYQKKKDGKFVDWVWKLLEIKVFFFFFFFEKKKKRRNLMFKIKTC
ncbi:hypothetical protein RFI_24622 [Reticulomyxa filosa]|uniref:Uncharacterized protein n=1 Tax=Reticulomyxa filosa TaxID=46433 RepID=X6MFF6_RETFI|nr:hypothetical protein RFI_24622 [Reticulomyxa filosa]|eukprot:ETO12753.1 hypothetical protein RFI_24622 [Reticulomyxa filosa]